MEVVLEKNVGTKSNCFAADRYSFSCFLVWAVSYDAGIRIMCLLRPDQSTAARENNAELLVPCLHAQLPCLHAQPRMRTEVTIYHTRNCFRNNHMKTLAVNSLDPPHFK